MNLPLRYSIRSLLVLTTLVAAGLGCWLWFKKPEPKIIKQQPYVFWCGDGFSVEGLGITARVHYLYVYTEASVNHRTVLEEAEVELHDNPPLGSLDCVSWTDYSLEPNVDLECDDQEALAKTRYPELYRIIYAEALHKYRAAAPDRPFDKKTSLATTKPDDWKERPKKITKATVWGEINSYPQTKDGVYYPIPAYLNSEP